MKIGNKYQYFTIYKKPTVLDFGDRLEAAKSIYDITIKYGALVLIEMKDAPLKTWRKRYKNIELKPGNKVNVCRWDWNGSPTETTIERIEEIGSYILVECEEGSFCFDGKTEPKFYWREDLNTPYNEHNCRINQNNYYYES